MRPDLDLGQSPSDTPGGGALGSQPVAAGAGRGMSFPASSVRRTWPAFAGAQWVDDGMGGGSWVDDGLGSETVVSGSNDSVAQDEADSAATVAAAGQSESSIWSSIGSGALSLAEAAMKYGPGIITAAANAGVIPHAQAQQAAAQARNAGVVAPVKAPPVGMSAGLAVGGLVAAAGLIYLLTRK
jgi:hypothetical protein